MQPEGQAKPNPTPAGGRAGFGQALLCLYQIWISILAVSQTRENRDPFPAKLTYAPYPIYARLYLPLVRTQIQKRYRGAMIAGPRCLDCVLTRQGDDMIMVVADPSPWQRRAAEDKEGGSCGTLCAAPGH